MNIDERFVTFATLGKLLWKNYMIHWVDHDRISRICYQYDSILSQLFQISLLEPNGVFIESGLNFRDFPPIFTIKISKPSQAVVLVSRNIEPSGYWDTNIDGLDLSGLELSFVSYFDFDEINGRNFEYVRGIITKFPATDIFVGRHALVSSESVQFAKTVTT